MTYIDPKTMTDVIKCECCDDLFERDAYDRHWAEKRYGKLNLVAVENHALGAEFERDTIVAYLLSEQRKYPRTEYAGFAAMIAEEIGAKEHLK